MLFAPCPATRENIRAIVEAAGAKPVNAIMSGYTGLAVSDLAEMGVRRISVGSALARAAKQIAEQGSFEAFEGLVPFAELNAMFDN